MSRDCHYDPSEGEFVDFETLDDWRQRDIAKDAEIKRLKVRQLPEVDKLAAIIREVDGANSLGAGLLAEAIISKMDQDQ